MNMYTLGALLLTTAVALGYINHRYIRLQSTIAMTCGAFLLSLGMLCASYLGIGNLEQMATAWMRRIDFHQLLMNGMLSFLLFAGSLTINFNELRRYKFEILFLSVLGTIASTALIGLATCYVLKYAGFTIPLIDCFLFGALISPTDPIAVLATLKQLKAPRDLTAILAGESLFNDGVGIVLFLSLYQLAFSGKALTVYKVSTLFLQQAIGGILYGILLGVMVYYLIRSVQDHTIEVLLTLALVTGGYSFAQFLHVSGPLAMVVSGIFLGNRGKDFAMSKDTRYALHLFWEMIDDILNTLLFLLIGFELLTIHMETYFIWIGCLMIPVTLLVRVITVILPLQLTKKKQGHSPHMRSVLIWGGLRGGLALALALSLPDNTYHDLWLTVTYCIVCFSVVIQGITVKPLIRLSREKDQPHVSATR